ncbi:MAG: hypothetical protein FWF73_00045 [Spirochaetes bacterium]|nr:hypothetical protein [Spirochaetota bacterium]
MLNRKGLLLIILFFVPLCGIIYGDQDSAIKWERVYGAGGYIVEIVDSDNNPVETVEFLIFDKIFISI